MAETVRDEITQLAGSIRALERQLEVALAKRRVELNYVVHDGIARFEHVMITSWSVFGRRRGPRIRPDPGMGRPQVLRTYWPPIRDPTKDSQALFQESAKRVRC